MNDEDRIPSGTEEDDEIENGVSVKRAPTKPEVVSGTKAPWSLRSVLKVFSTKVDPNYAQPWQMTPQRNATGSAFIISHSERLILTNSHVVSGAVSVFVRRPGTAKKFKAEILVDGKVCDLALLTVQDEHFWSGSDLRPLEFVSVPELQSPISVCGYPVGGDSLCITKGIVSRVTLNRYSIATRLLSIQIDAAINPGNSGGPAFSDLEQGKVAGVAFCKITTADNVGYIIPGPVINHFLHEYRQLKTYRGVPCCGFVSQDMENPAQRSWLSVPEGRTGVMIVDIDPLSRAAGVLKERDVVLEVQGHIVADDGTSTFRDDERIEYIHYVRSMHVGDTLSLKILRDGLEMDVSYELELKDHLVPMLHEVDCLPSYFISGGLVFVPLSQPFLEAMYGGGKRTNRRSDIPSAVIALINENKKSRDQQVVILLQVLAHEINHGYKQMMAPIETFNGEPVVNLKSLAAMVDKSFEDKSRYLIFGLEGGRVIILDREQVQQHQPTILKHNFISNDRSEDIARSEAAGGP